MLWPVIVTLALAVKKIKFLISSMLALMLMIWPAMGLRSIVSGCAAVAVVSAFASSIALRREPVCTLSTLDVTKNVFAFAEKINAQDSRHRKIGCFE